MHAIHRCRVLTILLFLASASVRLEGVELARESFYSHPAAGIHRASRLVVEASLGRVGGAGDTLIVPAGVRVTVTAQPLSWIPTSDRNPLYALEGNATWGPLISSSARMDRNPLVLDVARFQRALFEAQRRHNRQPVAEDWFTLVPGRGTGPDRWWFHSFLRVDPGTLEDYLARNLTVTELSGYANIPSRPPWTTAETLAFRGGASDGYPTLRVGLPPIQMRWSGDSDLVLKVVDFDGRPVAGEPVDLECLAWRESGQAGLWLVDELLSSRRAPEFPTSPHVLNPGLPADYAGRVTPETVTTDTAGEATVRLVWPTRAWATRSGSGAMTWTRLPVRVLASSRQGYLGLLQQVPALNPASVTIAFRKALHEEATQEISFPNRTHGEYALEGTVRDAAGGLPIEGVAVTVTQGATPATALTGPDGTYRIALRFASGTGVAPESIRRDVALNPDGIVVRCRKAPGDEVLRFLRLDGERSYTITGRVTDPVGGTPVAGATVETGGVSALTDAEGGYTLVVGGGAGRRVLDFELEEAAVRDIAVRKDGFTGAGAAKVRITPQSRIRGRVVYRGLPVHAATVSCYDPFRSIQHQVRTDVAGGYEIVLGQGLSDVSAGSIEFRGFELPELEDLARLEARLGHASRSVLHPYYAVGSLALFREELPALCASAGDADVLRWREAARRLGQVALEIATLDTLTDDYAEEVLLTLGAAFESVIAMTDLVNRMTELDTGEAKAATDALLEDARTGLNALFRHLVASLGLAMSGELPEVMRAGVEEFLQHLRRSGSDALRFELKQSLLAAGFRRAAQQALDTAAGRCRRLEFRGDFEAGKAAAYAFRQEQFEQVAGFLDTAEWRSYATTLADSTAEAAALSKYVGAVAGWYEIVEKVGAVSEALSQAVSGAGAAHALAQFHAMSDHVQTVTALVLGDPPGAGREAFTAASRALTGGQAEGGVDPMLTRIQDLAKVVQAGDRHGLLVQLPGYLEGWRRFCSEARAEMNRWEVLGHGGAAVTDAVRGERTRLQEAHRTVLAAGIQAHASLAAGLASGEVPLRTDVGQRFLELQTAVATWLDSRIRIQSLLDPGAIPVRLALGLAEAVARVEVGRPFQVNVTVLNTSAADVSGAVLEWLGDPEIDAAPRRIPLPAIRSGSNALATFACTLPALSARPPSAEFRVVVGAEEHDRVSYPLPVAGNRPPALEVRWPPAHRIVAAVEAIRIEPADGREEPGTILVACRLNESPVPVPESAWDAGGWTLPVPSVRGQTTNVLEVVARNAAGRTSTLRHLFRTGPSELPQAVVLEAGPGLILPGLLPDFQARVWQGGVTSAAVVVRSDSGQELRRTPLGARGAGTLPVTWDGMLAPGAPARPGFYQVQLVDGARTLASPTVGVVTNPCPLRGLRIDPGDSFAGTLWVDVELAATADLILEPTMGPMNSVFQRTLSAGRHRVAWSLRNEDGTPYQGTSLQVRVRVRTGGASWTLESLRLPLSWHSPPAVVAFRVPASVSRGALLEVELRMGDTEETHAGHFLVASLDRRPLLRAPFRFDAGSGLYAASLASVDLAAGDYLALTELVSHAGLAAGVEAVPFRVVEGSPVADADADGMEDAWEHRFGGDLQPGADPDGDSASNLDEWMAATDPTRPESVFRVAAEWVPATASVRLRWLGAEGRRYRVLGREDLTGPWSPVPGHEGIVGAGKELHADVSAGTGGFFRVEVRRE